MSSNIKTFSELSIYPELIWMSDWTFGFDPLSTSTAKGHNGTIFKTLPEKGSVSGSDPEAWKIHFRLPLKSHVNYFSNGFIVKRRSTLAVIAAPAPNVLCGFIQKRYGMELQCEHKHGSNNQTAHFQSESGMGALLQKEDDETIFFSLAVNTVSYAEAESLAEQHFTHTPEELIPLHETRKNLIKCLDPVPNLNVLPAIVGECLLKQLQVPEGILSEPWPASPALDNKAFSLNELYPLILAWSDVDPKYACSLYEMALNLQREDGHLPAWVTPSGDRNAFDAPLPFFVQCAEHLLQKTDDLAYAKKCLPKLNNYMRWSLRHFFPQNALHPAAQSAQETLASGLWNKNFASVEHTVLLICELEGLVHLHERTDSIIPLFITQSLGKLTALFEKEFWNPQTRTFSTCYQLEEKTTQYGLHEYLPLLYKNLDGEKRNSLLAQFKHSPWAQGFSTAARTGNQAAPATPLQQFIILQCMKNPANSHAQASAHAARTWENLILWQNRHFHHKTSTTMPVIDTAFICLLMDLQALRMKSLNKSASWIKGTRSLIHKLDITRDDLIIILVFSLLIVGTRQFYHHRNQAAATATLQEARASYQAGDTELTVKTCQALLKKEPDNKEGRLLLANILLALDAPQEAEEHYRILNKEDADNPAFIVGLAMSLHRQGHVREAMRYYQEFQDYFAPYFPTTSVWVTRMQNADTPKLSKYFVLKMLSSDFMLTL